MSIKKAVLRGLVLAGVVMPILATQAHADTITFNFNTLISGDMPNPDLDSIATMTITDTGADTVQIRLTHLDTSAAGQFISKAWLNIDPMPGSLTFSNFFNPEFLKYSGSDASAAITVDENGEQTAGISFDLSFLMDTSNNQDRLYPDNTVGFDISGAGLDASDFLSFGVPNGENPGNVYALIHLQGIEGGGSAKLGATEEAVPEPASIAALSLGALGLLKRRKKS